MENNLDSSQIEIIRGDTPTLTIVFKDNLGVPIDISNYTVFFTVKTIYDDDSTDADALIAKTISSHTDSTNGITAISLTSADTDLDAGDYYYDFQIKNGSTILSTKYGIIKVLPDITRRTS